MTILFKNFKKRLFVLAFAAGCCVAGTVLANPSGGSVVHGNVSFSQPNANTLNITNSPNAIINWQQFGIKPDEVTRFIQQSSNSAVLNRIIGQNPSQILGQLRSNGKVFIINPNGIIFGRHSTVNTAGLIASTLNISNRDFLNGRLHFADLENNAAILNQGFIHTSKNGEVVMVAPNIKNEGVINVENGHLVLAAGQSVTLSSLGYEDIQFEVQAPENSVVNLGDLISDGGSIGVFAGNIKHSGRASVNAIEMDDAGNIRFVAKKDTVINNGIISASSEKGKAGKVELLGERVGLFGKTSVTASAPTGGGEILVGGDYQGKGKTKTSKTTQVGSAVTIKADATKKGHGGKVIFWSDVYTRFSGTVTAKGGVFGGNGGFIEISGKDKLNFSGIADTSAMHGRAGTVLFDPKDIHISTGGVAYDGVTNDQFAESPTAIITFTNTSIANLLVTQNVILQASNDIFIDALADINVVGGVGMALTLQAGRSIDIRANVNTNGGALTLIANSNFVDGVVNAQRDPGAANITIGDGVQLISINTGGGNILMDIRGGTGLTNSTAGQVTINALSSLNAGIGLLAFDAGFVNNRGNINLLGNMDLRNVSTFTNAVDGVVDFQADVGITNTIGSATIDNFGFIQKSAGTQTSTIIPTLNNQARSNVIIDSGSLSLAGAPLVLNQAFLIGTGTFIGDVISKGGIVDVGADATGAIGTLTINGNLTLDASSITVFDLSGNATQGVSYDFLNVTGNVVLDGRLLLLWDHGLTTSSGLVSGSTLDLLQTGGVFSGAFSSILLPVGVTAAPVNFNTPNIMQLAGITVSPNIKFWLPSTGGNWNVGSNWSGGVVPTSTDFAVINQVNTNTVTVSDARSVQGLEAGDSLTLTGIGSLTLTGDSTIAGDFLTLAGSGGIFSDAKLFIATDMAWTSGSLGGAGSMTLLGPASLNITGNVTLSVANFINDGLINLNVGSLTLSNAGGNVFVNNGIFNANANGGVINTINGTESIINNGVFSINANTTFASNLIFSNNALVVIDPLSLSPVTLTFNATNPLTGIWNTGDANDAFTIANMTLATGALTGGGTVNGNVTVDRGVISVGNNTSGGSSGILTINGNLTLGANSAVSLDLGGTAIGSSYDSLNVVGNVTLDGALTLFWNNNFTSAPGNTFDLITAGSFSGAFSSTNVPVGVTASSFTPTPTTLLQFTTTTISPNIKFWLPTTGGNWNVGSNWTGGVVPGSTDYVVINQDVFKNTVAITDVQSVLAIQSRDNLDFSLAGALTLGNDQSLLAGFQLTLGSSGGITVNNKLILGNRNIDWNSGTFGGTGILVLSPRGDLNVNTSASLPSSLTFINKGDVVLNPLGGTPVTFTVNSNGNNHTGIWDIRNASDSLVFTGTNNFVNSIVTGLGTFSNTGLLTNNATGFSAISVAFTNSGIVDAQSGILGFSSSYTQTAGTTRLSGGALNLLTLNLNGGSLTGSGTITGNVINNGGVVEPGGVSTIGSLTITGDYTQSATGATVIEIQNGGSPGLPPVAGSDYDLLAIGGAADLQGDLSLFALSGYTVTNNDSFTPITYGTKTTNTFSVINAIAGETVVPSYTGDIIAAGNLNLVLQTGPININWTGLGDGVSWNDIANWNLSIPTITDDVTIGNFNITIAGGGNVKTLILGSSGLLTLNSGTFTIANTSTLAGSFTVNTGSSLVSNGLLTIDGILTLNAGTLANAQNVLIRNTFNWNGGMVTGLSGQSLNIASGATMNMTAANSDLLLDTVNLMTAAGSTANFSSNFNDLFLNLGSVWTNAGTLNLVNTAGAADILNDNNSFVSLINTGTLNVSSVGTNASLFTPFDNQGVVNINSNFFIERTTQNSGTINWQSGNITLNGNLTNAGNFNSTIAAAETFTGVGNFTNSGLLFINSSSTTDIQTIFSLNTGTVAINSSFGLNGNDLIIGANSLLTGNGTFLGNVVNTAGMVAPGAASVGQLTISGNYTQGVNGNLELEAIGAGSPGFDYDLLMVGGNTILAGKLNVVPLAALATSGTFNLNFINTAGSTTGNFTKFNMPVGFDRTQAASPGVLSFGGGGTNLIFFDNEVGDFNASNPLNWSLDTGPGTLGFDAVVTLNGSPITFNSGNFLFNSFASDDTVNNNGANLGFLSNVAIAGNFNQNGVSSNARFDGLFSVNQMNNNLGTILLNNNISLSALNNTGDLTINGNVNLSGNFNQTGVSSQTIINGSMNTGNLDNAGILAVFGQLSATNVTNSGNLRVAGLSNISGQFLQNDVTANTQFDSAIMAGQINNAAGRLAFSGDVSTTVINNAGELVFNSQVTSAGVSTTTNSTTNSNTLLAQFINANGDQVTTSQVNANINNDGIMSGNVDINGDVTNNGTLFVGENGVPGALRINGNLILLNNSELVFDIAGLNVLTGYDALNVTGNIGLNGVIRLNVNPDGYNSSNASFNDLFTPLKYGSRLGSAKIVATTGYDFAATFGATGIELKTRLIPGLIERLEQLQQQQSEQVSNAIIFVDQVEDFGHVKKILIRKLKKKLKKDDDEKEEGKTLSCS